MTFRRGLSAYADPANAGVWEVIKARAVAEPFYVAVTVTFALAVLHTFFCPKLLRAAQAAPKCSGRGRVLHVLGEAVFTENLKYAVVAGAVTGGGLTVIANAPNPAGQSLLQRYFPKGVSPLGLFLGALGPTPIIALLF